MEQKNISDHIKFVRREFNDAPLESSNLKNNPLQLFEQWMQEATDADLLDPFAMCFSTVDKDNIPDSRILYLRGMTEEGYIFYTNYESDKGVHIRNNPKVSLNFFWNEISRQVKIKGDASFIDAAISDEYFSHRPRRSQLGAWASDQSREIKDRNELEDKLAALDKKYEGMAVPRPPHWGGILVKPFFFEFWKGRVSRLHDRYVYDKVGDDWQIKRLSP